MPPLRRRPGGLHGAGHTDASYTEPLFLKHLLGGIRMAAGAAKFNCGGEQR
ncbi:hypothetical protein ACFY3U_11410 [Micromonospora sp. NPDC000089]|uniref:hypothetical protein n=1 Tax=unclassified Micromonospora TaxID=2617518 RepID=UPI003692ED1F